MSFGLLEFHTKKDKQTAQHNKVQTVQNGKKNTIAKLDLSYVKKVTHWTT